MYVWTSWVGRRSPTTRYGHSRIACIAFFCFYTSDDNEVRGVRMMLDFDLSKLYQVETKVLKQSVRRKRRKTAYAVCFYRTWSDNACRIAA